MRKSHQDRYYLETEGDNFFHRNFSGKKLPELRDTKVTLLEHIQEARIQFERVLEYGCNYGDLLNYFKHYGLAIECVGIEASRAAVNFGKKRYADSLQIVHGTLADNPLNNNTSKQNYFDLVIVDDVFGWVSRETLLQSVTNIDSVLKDGGHLFIRDFLPDKRVKNSNHHVANGDVFNYKVPGSHAGIFLACGTYDVVWQKTYYDDTEMSVGYRSDNPFNYRWTDVVLKKSYRDNFQESQRLL